MSNKILIVVDCQNDFITGVLGSPEAQAIVENVKAKIIEYRSDGHHVYFTRDTHYSDYMMTQEGKKLPVPHCLHNTHGWAIVDGLDSAHRWETDYINKPTFGYLDWDKRLSSNITSIEIVGVCTDICVVSNALILKAAFPEAEITVDASCCAGVTPEKHKAALEVMKSCQINVIGE